MKINVKAAGFEFTPSLNVYIEDKLGGLSKLIKRFDEEGVAELWLDLSRTTRHHQKGDVFRAEADLRLPRKILRAQKEAGDIRAAIDILKDTLRLEIDKYKTRSSKIRRTKTE
jgi:ribosomal subunit interface protein